MTALKHLLPSFSNKEIVDSILLLYPEEKKNKRGYLDVLKQLRVRRPYRDAMIIHLEKLKEVNDDIVETSIHVFGTVSTDKETTYSLAFTTWGKWLAMDIDEQSLVVFSTLEIISHCLYELTWYGFSEQEHTNVLKLVVGRAKKYEKK